VTHTLSQRGVQSEACIEVCPIDEVCSKEMHLPGEQVLLLGVRSTSGFEYLYPALQSLVVPLERSDQIIP
jgi:hypothetical protein